jgi:hypothetical protein
MQNALLAKQRSLKLNYSIYSKPLKGGGWKHKEQKPASDTSSAQSVLNPSALAKHPIKYAALYLAL